MDSEGSDHTVLSHSRTRTNPNPCLDFLFGLHDSHLKGLGLVYNVPEDDEGEPPICPLTNRCLEKLLIQNVSRENAFYSMTFTQEQSRVHAGSGTNIRLYDCSFSDGDVAFVDAALQHSSLTKLTLWERLPLDELPQHR
jgi:hypothetical protein